MCKKWLSILILSILVASTLGGCTPASSTPSTFSTLTILSITKGNVFVMKAGTDSWIEAEVGMSLEAGDAIKTDDFSSAEITFFDGSTIELQAGTEVEVVSLDISTDTGSTTITLEQTIGTTISRVTKLLDPASRYEVETPTGVAAVRGSSMLVEVFADGSTSVTNIAGEIWFTYDGGELQIPVGGVCIIKFGELPRLILWGGLEGGIGGGSNDIVTDLAIDKSDSSDPVNPGTNLIYTLQITNNGPSDSTGAVVLDALPSGVSFVSATDGGTYDSDSHAVRWAIGTLAKDASTSVNITVRVNESASPGIITNIATVDANETENYPANNAVTEDTTINTVNGPPLAKDDAAITDEDNPLTIDAPGVLNNDSDPDVGDTLTLTAVNTSGTVGNVTAWDADGSFTYDPNGQFEYLPAGGSTTDSFTYTVSDGNGGTDDATVTITITGLNDLPVAVNDSYITNVDTAVTIDVLNNDYDIDGDVLTVVSTTNSTYGSVTNNSSNVTYDPPLDFSGTDSFTYTISDGNGGIATATVTVTVTNTLTRINVTIDTGPTASIFIWDDTTHWWATDEDTQEEVDGNNHVTSDAIMVTGGHYYYVWVEEEGVIYNVKKCPKDWTITSAPIGNAEAAYGFAAEGVNYPVHFTIK